MGENHVKKDAVITIETTFFMTEDWFRKSQEHSPKSCWSKPSPFNNRHKLMHGDCTPISCTVTVRLYHARWLHAYIMHGDCTPISCTVTVRLYHAQWLYAYIMHSDCTPISCTVTVRLYHARWLYAYTMHGDCTSISAFNTHSIIILGSFHFRSPFDFPCRRWTGRHYCCWCCFLLLYIDVLVACKKGRCKTNGQVVCSHLKEEKNEQIQ